MVFLFLVQFGGGGDILNSVKYGEIRCRCWLDRFVCLVRPNIQILYSKSVFGITFSFWHRILLGGYLKLDVLAQVMDSVEQSVLHLFKTEVHIPPLFSNKLINIICLIIFFILFDNIFWVDIFKIHFNKTIRLLNVLKMLHKIGWNNLIIVKCKAVLLFFSNQVYRSTIEINYLKVVLIYCLCE